MRALPLVALLLTACAEVERVPLDCPATNVESQTVPQTKTALHWLLGECLETSYSPAVAQYAPEIRAAFAAWSAPSCSLLCLLEPVELAAPSGTGSIHVTVLEDTSSLAIAPVESRYHQTDGSLIASKISLNEPVLPAHLERVLLYAVGKALGFEAAEGVSSVMNPPQTDDGLRALTAEDEAAICGKYGADCE